MSYFSGSTYTQMSKFGHFCLEDGVDLYADCLVRGVYSSYFLCIIWLLSGCQYQRNRLPGKTHPQNDLVCYVFSGTLNSKNSLKMFPHPTNCTLYHGTLYTHVLPVEPDFILLHMSQIQL